MRQEDIDKAVLWFNTHRKLVAVVAGVVVGVIIGGMLF